MIKIGLKDSNFIHHGEKASISSFPGHTILPKYFEWERNEDCDITIFTDNCLEQAKNNKSKIKIAWILEPRVLIRTVYEYIRNNYNDFDYVLTHDVEFIGEIDINEKKFKYCFFSGNWISQKDWSLNYPKTKNICIIASYKNNLPGHKLRHQIISELSNRYGIDVYGNGYKPFENMIDVLKNYKHCIVVENVSNYGWNTEKIWSPMSVGCVPLYYGDKLINYTLERDRPHGEMGDFCIPEFENIDELEKLLNNEHVMNYDSKYCQDLIKTNFSQFKEYSCSEDGIWKTLNELNLI